MNRAAGVGFCPGDGDGCVFPFRPMGFSRALFSGRIRVELCVFYFVGNGGLRCRFSIRWVQKDKYPVLVGEKESGGGGTRLVGFSGRTIGAGMDYRDGKL